VFSEELQDVIDALLGQACPDWTPSPRVATTADDADQRRYERIEVTRLRLGQALTEQPDLAARLSDTIFKAVLLEYSVTDQLTAPLIAAVGRRFVLEQLIDAVIEGPCERRANAAGAAYWVRCWRHPQESALLRSAYDQGARSSAELRSYVERHLPRDIGCYPPEFAGLLEQARRIAAADPDRFQRMRGRSTGYGYRI
jgi:hypothetical protein